MGTKHGWKVELADVMYIYSNASSATIEGNKRDRRIEGRKGEKYEKDIRDVRKRRNIEKSMNETFHRQKRRRRSKKGFENSVTELADIYIFSLNRDGTCSAQSVDKSNKEKRETFRLCGT